MLLHFHISFIQDHSLSIALVRVSSDRLPLIACLTQPFACDRTVGDMLSFWLALCTMRSYWRMCQMFCKK